MPESAVVDVATTSTPAPSSPTSGTPTSAPATSAIATTPTTTPASERPTDAKSLSKFMQKQDGDLAADATTPKPPLVTDPAAAATVQPPEPLKAGAPDLNAAKGPIPFDVHHTALANARTAAVAEYKKQHGWAEQFKPDQRDWLIDVAKRMTDPVAFHRWFGEQLSAHPQYQTQLAAPAANAKPQPDVEIHDGNGKVVGMGYSAAKQEELLAWNSRQVEGKFTQMLQPFQQEREHRLEQERIDQQQKDLNTRADGVMTQVNKILRLDKLPADEQAALGKKLLDEMSRTPDAVEAALAVFERDVVPSLEKKGQQAALDTNLKKAAANTANGNGPASHAPRPKSAKELAAWMAQNNA